jgi:hypothetical protein
MIKLQINYGKHTVLLDNMGDCERLSKYKWQVGRTNHIVRHERQKRPFGGYKVVGISMANEVMQTRGIKYDHINRDSFDNRRSNLRVATYSQNSANSSKRTGTSSKYKGVIWFKRDSLWMARICSRHLGYFKLEIDAARAYNKAAIDMFKEFANLNKDENGNVLC